MCLSWYDMEYNEFVDFVRITNETFIISSQIKKKNDTGIVNINETDLESIEMHEKRNLLKLILVSGHFGGFDRKKSKKNIEIVVNIIGLDDKNKTPLNIIKL